MVAEKIGEEKMAMILQNQAFDDEGEFCTKTNFHIVTGRT